MTAVKCCQCLEEASVEPDAENRWYETHTCDPDRLATIPPVVDHRLRGQRPRDRGRGDCYQVAGNLIVELGDGHVLCHGEPLGQGPIAGLRHGHAWIERTRTIDWPTIGLVTVVDVIDRSNGRDLEMPAAVYYNIGRTEDRPIRRYTREQAIERMLTTGTYGPWEDEP